MCSLVASIGACNSCGPTEAYEESASDAFACEVDLDCRGGEICNGGICVAARPDDDGEGTPTYTNPEDAGLPRSDSGVLPTDGGTPLLDGGSQGSDPDGGEMPPQAPSPWLLSVNGAADTLIKIDVVTGETTTVCAFEHEANYPSTTFGLDGTLYGFEAAVNALDIIDPCTCEVTRIGHTVDEDGLEYDNIPGITANGEKIEKLFGISTDQDKLLELVSASGRVQPIGSLGVDFHYSGTTWSTELGGLYALNDTTDALYILNTETGLASEWVTLDIDVGLVGIEYHTENGKLYVCTNNRVYDVNVQDGSTEIISLLNYPCNNLAAPWQNVSCIDELP